MTLAIAGCSGFFTFTQLAIGRPDKAGPYVSKPAPPAPSGRHGETDPDRSRPVRSRSGRCRPPAVPAAAPDWSSASTAAACEDRRRRSQQSKAIELHLVIVPAANAARRNPIGRRRPTAPPRRRSRTSALRNVRASTISGYRSVQSWPLRVNSPRACLRAGRSGGSRHA